MWAPCAKRTSWLVLLPALPQEHLKNDSVRMKGGMMDLKTVIVQRSTKGRPSPGPAEMIRKSNQTRGPNGCGVAWHPLSDSHCTSTALHSHTQLKKKSHGRHPRRRRTVHQLLLSSIRFQPFWSRFALRTSVRRQISLLISISS